MDVKRIGLILGVCLFLDALWLTFRFGAHQKLISDIQKSPLAIRFLPALAVYILIALALWYFVISSVYPRSVA